MPTNDESPLNHIRFFTRSFMNIAKNKMVTVDYTVKIETGKVMDSSKGGKPLSYIHGLGNMIPGFEAALEGKETSRELTFSVDASEGYGEHRSNLLFSVPREKFVGVQNLDVGMQFMVETPQGTAPMTISCIDDDTVELDANHPLAGHTLTFDVEIVDVRDATEKELEEAYSSLAPGCSCSDRSCQEGGCKPD
jgi:FKBP-type peptidyl-prolyl cis-trans isomerase SlyD